MININNKHWDKLRFSDIEKMLAQADDETFFSNSNLMRNHQQNLQRKFPLSLIHLEGIFF